MRDSTQECCQLQLEAQVCLRHSLDHLSEGCQRNRTRCPIRGSLAAPVCWELGRQHRETLGSEDAATPRLGV